MSNDRIQIGWARRRGYRGRPLRAVAKQSQDSNLTRRMTLSDLTLTSDERLEYTPAYFATDCRRQL